MPTYTGLSVFSDLLLVRGAFWGNGLAASCTLQTPLPGGRSGIIRTGAEPYSLNCRIPSRRILLENRASGIRGSRKLAPYLALGYRATLFFWSPRLCC